MYKQTSAWQRRLLGNLRFEVHKVLRLRRDVHVEVGKALCLPRNVHFEVHKVLRLPRYLHVELHKALPHQQTRISDRFQRPVFAK